MNKTASLTSASPSGGGRLIDELRSMIAQEGPIPVERYMALVLGHPTLGYYTTRAPFGAAGDFVTAPEISQMFGELLGLWAAEVWFGLGCPASINLVELGPGRGTLMADALRASGAAPAFKAAAAVHLVETSPVLRHLQEGALALSGAAATWHDTVDTVPAGPMIVLANEFFDALPIRQFVRTQEGWRERLVGLDAAEELAFGVAAERGAPAGLDRRSAPLGAIVEVNEAADRVMTAIAARLADQGGALLAIDYGHDRASFGDTLQAVRAHRFVDVLATPGFADVTAHVDFAALTRAATRAGATPHGPVPQGAFLRSLGIAQRAAALKARATAEQAAEIDAAVVRLTGPDPDMGDLFKVLAVTGGRAPVPSGFAPGS